MQWLAPANEGIAMLLLTVVIARAISLAGAGRQVISGMRGDIGGMDAAPRRRAWRPAPTRGSAAGVRRALGLRRCLRARHAA